MIEVLAAGPLATVQDAGRSGWAALGVARSGAFDRRAAALANRLVGNASDAAVLEITFGGLDVELHDAATVALTGARCHGVLDHGVAVTLPAKTRLRLGTPTTGLRTYLAVRGGIAVPAVLGSRSTDTLSGLGPPPLAAGDRLPIGNASVAEVAGVPAVPGPRAPRLSVLPGPRADWFAADAVDLLVAAAWTVRAESDRIGVRLDGPRLARVRTEELPSEPVLPGAVQVPTDGRPLVFGPDAPVTGGYPVLAVLTAAALDELAQARPGDRVRFSRSSRAARAT
jgi:biotin-dependent carboxylase-like uncharacterized protein